MKILVLNELKTEFGKVFLPDRKYYYHISTIYAKDSIIKNGLSTKFKGTRKKPNQGIPTDMRAVYLTNNPYKLIHPDNGSGSFFHQVDELVLFRVKKSFVHNLHKDEQYPLGDTEGTFAFYIYQDIPPEELEYMGEIVAVISNRAGYHVIYPTLSIYDDKSEEEKKQLKKMLLRDKLKISIYTELENPGIKAKLDKTLEKTEIGYYLDYKNYNLEESLQKFMKINY